ncbi:hypothetical protein Emed_007348 [Eimeria media]
MAQRNSSQAPGALTFRPGLSTMEFQGSSPPATPARREQTQAGGAELGAANPRPAYYNLDAQAVLFTPTRHPGPSIRLEPFDGTKFRMWIRVADAYYEALNLRDEDRIKNVQFHLTGDALDYWLMLNEDAPENRPSNWEEFKAVMSRRFDTSDAYTALYALSKLKYEGDFNRYVSEFGKLIARSKRLPADEVRRRFLVKLPPSLVQLTVREYLPTWTHVAEYLRQVFEEETDGMMEWYHTMTIRERAAISQEVKDRHPCIMMAIKEDEEVQQILRRTKAPDQAWGGSNNRSSERNWQPKEYGDPSFPPKPRSNRPSDITRTGGSPNKPFKPHARDEERKQDSSSCFTCGGKGHRQRQCPNSRMGDRGEGANCNRCGGKGHWAVLCPSPPPTDYVIRPRENRGVKTETAHRAQGGNGTA